MIKLQDQCCSVEQAKTLKELGVKQDSFLYHFPNPNTEDVKKKYDLPDYNILVGKEYIGKSVNNLRTMVLKGALKLTYSAFTASELCIMLGDNYPSWSFKPKGKWAKKWIATAINKNEKPDGKNITTAPEFDRYADTQAQALAEILIDAIKIGHIKIKDVNKRLKG